MKCNKTKVLGIGAIADTHISRLDDHSSRRPLYSLQVLVCCFKRGTKQIYLSESSRWLTVVSKEEPDGVEVLLEPAPTHFEPARIYQKALFDAGIPYTQFNTDDVQKEYERLINLDVEFSVKPTEMGTVKIAVFNDACGNNIQIVEMLWDRKKLSKRW